MLNDMFTHRMTVPLHQQVPPSDGSTLTLSKYPSDDIGKYPTKYGVVLEYITYHHDQLCHSTIGTKAKNNAVTQSTTSEGNYNHSAYACEIYWQSRIWYELVWQAGNPEKPKAQIFWLLHDIHPVFGSQPHSTAQWQVKHDASFKNAPDSQLKSTKLHRQTENKV